MASLQNSTATTTNQIRGPHYPLLAKSGGLEVLLDRLKKIKTLQAVETDMITKYLDLLSELVNGYSVAYIAGKSSRLSGAIEATENESDRLDQELLTPIRSRLIENVKTDGVMKVGFVKRFCLIVCPVYNGRDRSLDTIALTVVAKRAETESYCLAVQTVSSSLELFWQQLSARSIERDAQIAASTVELLNGIYESQDFDSACVLAANELATMFAAEQVAVGVARRPSSKTVVIKTLSPRTNFESNSDVGRALKLVLEEAVIKDELSTFPSTGPGTQESGLLGHRKLIKEFSFQNATSLPLKTGKDERIGAICFLNRGVKIDSGCTAIQAVCGQIATALQRVKQRDGGPVKKFLGGLKSQARKAQVLVCVALLILGLVSLFIPIDHRITGQCTIEPSQRRFSAVPYDGIFRESKVQPGDVVSAGQLLATMDDEEIRLRLISLQAQKEQIAKSIDTNLSKRNLAQMQVDQLELKRVNLEIEVQQQRLENLAIRSPVDGVILDGDLNDAVGAPVEMGQTLYEIAPLNRLKLQVFVTEQDHPFVEKDSEVEFWLSSDDKKMVGRITRIHPQAELRNETNGFVCDVEFEYSQNMLSAIRPGMSGIAHILSDKKPVYWIYFQRPARQLLDWLRL